MDLTERDGIERFDDVIIIGKSAAEPIEEVDVLLIAPSGHEYSMNVMTTGRYDDVRQQEPDTGFDEEAPRIFVLNTETLALDALVRMLKTVDRETLAPFLQPIQADQN